MKQIADGIHRLGSAHHNYYVVTEGGKATVIDAGGSKDMPQLVEGLASLGLAPTDVEAIVLTHAHADHIGFAAEASRGGTTVKTHEREAPIARGDEEGYSISMGKLPWWKPGTYTFAIAMMKSGVNKAPRVPEVETFTDGEVLDLPGRPKGIHAPGHTPGHAIYYLEGSKALFTGDALGTRDLTSKATGPQLFPAGWHDDYAAAKESLGLLAALDTKVLLPGHGEPFTGQASDAIAQARARLS